MKYQRGLVVGKFSPPHMGHHYLIDTAMSQSKQLWLLVVDSPVGEPQLDADKRVEILSELHPGAIVKVMPDLLIDDNSEYWAEYTREYLGFTPDAVFTSEQYGEPWAEALGCDHVQVDKARNKFSISGTQVRRDPLNNLEWVKPVTRSHLVKRICVVGAESTGTTTLANALGEHYETVVVPEFGRVRDERHMVETGKPYDWPTEDFYYTATVQQAIEDRLAREANKVLVCDTDAIATHIWHYRYLGYFNNMVGTKAMSRDYDLYIVTSPYGVEPEDDGFRFEMERREEMHGMFLDILSNNYRRYIVVEGAHEERMNQATRAIDKILDNAQCVVV